MSSLRFVLYTIAGMRRIGVHTSIAGGLHLSLRRAHDLGCNTLQIFTHNPRTWHVTPIGEDERKLFRKLRSEFDLNPVFAHASYLINIASADRELREKSILLLAVEMERAGELGADHVVLHAGIAHDADGKHRTSRSIRKALKSLRGGGVGLLIENTAGRRGDISSSMEDLAWIIEHSAGLVSGICLDSCHAFAAGYDIRTVKGLKALSAEIENRIGMNMLKLIHLNDSRGAAGSGIDRHEHIGTGIIGSAALRRLVNHKPFRHKPIILETPKKNDADDLRNLAAVRRMLSQ